MGVGKKSKLQEALDQIKEICQSHGVYWRLLKIIGDEDGARISIADVKPENKTAYLHELMGMQRDSDAPDLVEAEAELIITRDGGSFDIKKGDGAGVLDTIRPKLEEFYAFAVEKEFGGLEELEDKPTKDEQYTSPTSRPGVRQKHEYKWARRKIAEGQDEEEVYWEWLARYERKHTSILKRNFRKAMRYKPKTWTI